MPDVAATAAPVHSTAAPGYVAEPARTPVTPWVYLSSLAPGTGQRAATSAASNASVVDSRQVEADVDQFDAAAVAQRMNGLEATEGHGQRGVHVRAVGGAGLHVDAAGEIDGDDGNARCVDGGEHLGGVRAAAGRSRRCRRRRRSPDRLRRNAFDDPAAGPPECGQRLGVCAFGLEQDRGGRGAATAQERRRPQCVAAVVPGSDDRAHPPARDTPVSRTSSRAIAVASPCAARRIRAPSGRRRQQRRFGVADRIGGVVVPHRCPRYVGWCPDVEIRAAADATSSRPRSCERAVLGRSVTNTRALHPASLRSAT